MRQAMISAFAAIGAVAAAALASAAEPLTIVNMGIRQVEDGAPLPSTFVYTPGDIMYFGFQVTGYKVADEKVHLSYQVSALDPAGVPVMEPIKGVIDATLAAEDKESKP